jgi:SAM-dependent methyltransferase
LAGALEPVIWRRDAWQVSRDGWQHVGVDMSATTPPVLPTNLIRTSLEVYPAFALLAAMDLDVFTPLRNGPLTAAALAQELGVEPDRLLHLLYVLVQSKFLTLDGDQFRNSSEADVYLVRGKPTYMGDVQGFLRVNWGAALKTAQSIRLGAPQSLWMSLPEEDRRAWLNSLGVTAGWTVSALLARFEIPASASFADVGGGIGVVALALTAARPGLRGTVIEHPDQAPMARDRIAEVGATERVDVVAADVLAGPLSGRFDFAILRNVLQMFGPDDAVRVLRNVREIIVPGGAIFVDDWVLDDSRLGPAPALGHNLTFVSLFDRGTGYTERDYRGWLEAAGYVGFERFVPPSGESIMRAVRPT